MLGATAARDSGMKRLLSVILLALVTAGTPAVRAGVGSSPEAAAASGAQSKTLATVHGREGFWRLGKDQNGVWWFVRPDGRREFLNCVTTVQPHLQGRVVGAPRLGRALDERPGDGPVGGGDAATRGAVRLQGAGRVV
jgi:hypothetical protein